MAFNDFWAMPSFWQRWTNDRVSDCVHSENSNPFSFTKVQRKVIGIHSQKTRPEWLVRLSEAARQEAGNYIMRENTVHGSYKPAAEWRPLKNVLTVQQLPRVCLRRRAIVHFSPRKGWKLSEVISLKIKKLLKSHELHLHMHYTIPLLLNIVTFPTMLESSL